MSLMLTGERTVPGGVVVRTFNDCDTISIGPYTISADDFASTVMHFLTSTDLAPKDDPRIELIRRISKLRRIEGWSDPSRKRLGYRTQKRRG